MATKKKVKKEVVPARPVLEGWELKFAKKLKWTRNIQFMTLEFVLAALELDGGNDDDVQYARNIISNLERPE